MNTRVDKDNGISVGMVKGGSRNFLGFQAIDFVRTLVVSFCLLTLILGVQGYGRSRVH